MYPVSHTELNVWFSQLIFKYGLYAVEYKYGNTSSEVVNELRLVK